MGGTCQCSVLHGYICAQYSLAVRGQTDSALTARHCSLLQNSGRRRKDKKEEQ